MPKLLLVDLVSDACLIEQRLGEFYRNVGRQRQPYDLSTKVNVYQIALPRNGEAQFALVGLVELALWEPIGSAQKARVSFDRHHMLLSLNEPKRLASV